LDLLERTGAGMRDFEKILQGQNGELLKGLARSEEVKRLGESLDIKSIEKAAERGDMAALEAAVKSVLKTEEGRKLAEKLRKI